MAKFKVAIISCGMIANNAHIPAYKHLPDMFEIVGVSDINEKAAKDTAERNDIPHWYQDAGKMLDDLCPDVVSVCVPNAFHKEYTLMALRHGAHVLCEKPLAVTYADALEVYEEARKQGKHLMACQTVRYTPDRIAAKDLIAEGILGDIYYSEFSRIRRRGIPKWGTFHIKELSCGGAFIDIGVHMVDTLLWLTGNPKVVSVSGTTAVKIGNQENQLKSGLRESGALSGFVHNERNFSKDELNVEEFASGSISFENGMRTNFKVAWALNMPDETGFTLLGDKAGLVLPQMQLYGSTGSYPADFTPKINNDDPYQKHPFGGHFHLLDHFSDVLLGKCEQMISPEETINVAAIIDCFYRSAKTGKEVFLEDIK
ncbi:MAG: Gfo/Idh/MocA family oxidoreductase [Bacillota bacterium]|nr:Gfo/Idh/MocA family oxidoreductase [Bacillota bacterium]